MKCSLERWLKLSVGCYRWLLLMYPADFRRTYGTGMVQVFRDTCRASWRDRGEIGLISCWLQNFVDLFLNAVVERWVTLMRTTSIRLTYLIALVLSLILGYLDHRATEVQGSVIILLVLCFLSSFFFPRGGWTRAIIIGMGIPLVSWIYIVVGQPGPASGLPFHLDTLLALVPAMIGAGCGSGMRKVVEGVRQKPA